MPPLGLRTSLSGSSRLRPHALHCCADSCTRLSVGASMKNKSVAPVVRDLVVYWYISPPSVFFGDLSSCSPRCTVGSVADPEKFRRLDKFNCGQKMRTSPYTPYTTKFENHNGSKSKA